MRFANLYIFFFAALVLASCGQVNGPEDNKMLAPPVKTETKWLCENDSQAKIHTISRKEFDRKGNLALHIEYDESGRKVSESVYTNTENGYREEYYVYGKDGEVTKKQEFIYFMNDQGNISRKITLDGDGIKTNVIIFSYDHKGNLIKRTEYNSAGDIDIDIEYSYSYSDDGRIIERVIKSAQSTDCRRDSLVYQNDLNRIERFSFDFKGDIRIIHTYIYNASGQIKTELHTDSEGNIVRRFLFEYEYYK